MAFRQVLIWIYSLRLYIDLRSIYNEYIHIHTILSTNLKILCNIAISDKYPTFEDTNTRQKYTLMHQ